MKRWVWVGGLVLGLAGQAADLSAQQTRWRAAARPPARVAMSSAELTPCPTSPPGQAVQLGRPEPLLPRPSAPSGLVPVGYQVPAATRPGVGTAVIAASAAGLPTWSDVSEEVQTADFAADRPGEGIVPVAGAPLPAPPVATLPAPSALPGPSGPLPDGTPAPSRDWIGGPTPLTAPPPYLFSGTAEPFGPSPFDEPRQPRFYLRGEYLLWFAKDDHVPPLVTTSAPQDSGFLGQPTTQVLFGGGNLDHNPYNGFRLTGGYWLDGCSGKAIEVGGFYVGGRSANFQANSGQFPVLARPFFGINQGLANGGEVSELLAFPNQLTGTVQVVAPSNLGGAQANMLCNLCCCCNYRVSALAGFRYLNLQESITIIEKAQGLATNPIPAFQNAQFTAVDRFATTNQFVGGQIGLDGVFYRGPWSLGWRGVLGLGNTHQTLNIDGSTTVTNANASMAMFRGGLLALPSNIGNFSRDRFSVVPQVGLNVGYQLTPNLRAFVGYNFLYWSNVIRPGDQIDRVLDISQVPSFRNATTGTVQSAGQTRPAVLFHETDFWIQGVSFGVELIW